MKTLGFLWVLPISILFWVLYSFLYLFKQVKSISINTTDFTFIWTVRWNSWVGQKLFLERNFIGFSAGNNILIVEVEGQDLLHRLIRHEAEHCRQQYQYGIFFIIFYALESLRVYLFDKGLSPYYHNRFEIAARKAEVPR